MTRSLNLLAGAALFLGSAPTMAAAQFENLLSSVNDVNFFFSCWHPKGNVERRGECPVGKNGYGLEVMWNLGPIPLPGSPRKLVPEKCEPTKRETTTGPNATTVTSCTLVPAKEVALRFVHMELALGYSQFSGFQSASDSFEIVGSVRELPSVAMYGTLLLEDLGFPLGTFHPYLGVKTGLIQLNNVQLIDRGTADTLVTYAGTAQAFQLGALFGMAVSLGERVHLFIERGYLIRQFPSVQWSAGTSKVLDTFPTTLDFSGRTITAGIQISLRDPPP
jgi:hypothetical protein